MSNLVCYTPFKDFSETEQRIIREIQKNYLKRFKLCTETIKNHEYRTNNSSECSISLIFEFNTTKEGYKYWKTVRKGQFLIDILNGKFKYLFENKTVSEKIDELLLKLKKYEE